VGRFDHLIDWSSARRINEATKRVNVDFPPWMVRGLDDQDNALSNLQRPAIHQFAAMHLVTLHHLNKPAPSA